SHACFERSSIAKSYLDNQVSFQECFKKLKVLELKKCHVSFNDIVAICNLENLSELTVTDSKFSENSTHNRTSKQQFHLNIEKVRIMNSDEILSYLAQNASMKGDCAEFGLSSTANNFTQNLSTSQRPWYFNEKLAVQGKDNDVKAIAESIVSLL